MQIRIQDLCKYVLAFLPNPKQGEVYNAGGGRHSNCSMLEAIQMSEKITGKKMNYSYTETNRIGDHIWWISDMTKFKAHYPNWEYKYDINDILEQIHHSMVERV